MTVMAPYPDGKTRTYLDREPYDPKRRRASFRASQRRTRGTVRPVTRCPVCHGEYATKGDGTMWRHRDGDHWCAGSDAHPVTTP